MGNTARRTDHFDAYTPSLRPVPFTFRGQRRDGLLAPVVEIGTTPVASALRAPSPAALASRMASRKVAPREPPVSRPAPGVCFAATASAALDRFGITRDVAAALVEEPDIVAPDDQNTPGREVRYGGEHGFICAVDESESGQRTIVVIGAFERHHGGGQPPESLRERPSPRPRYIGAGRATGTMPTSFEEVVARVENCDGWHVEQGRGKHPVHIVSDDGQHRFPVPTSASDFRAVRNLVALLRAVGLDVRRPVGGAKR